MVRSTRSIALGILVLLAGIAAGARSTSGAAAYRLVGWNDLGMHCMDADFAVFSILPPYNTVVAQLVDPRGRLVEDPAGITVTYEAVADPTGSINRTSVGKTNFWQHAAALFGAAPAADVGLRGNAMPGTANAPQAMAFQPDRRVFTAEGIPITPRDDAGAANPYPLMRLVAHGASGAELASTQVVLPVSDEMDCRTCHGSGSGPAARPAAGWVQDPDADRDYRLNILRLHDESRRGDPTFDRALVQAGYAPDGLFATAVDRGTPILCARCHASNALGTTGASGVPALTSVVHAGHARVVDPVAGTTLDAAANRGACYRCHPGATTRCLRGAMGAAVAPDGTMAMQCQSCHGGMRSVGAPGRAGWLDQPACQSCHTGNAVANAGQIRYETVFDDAGAVRAAVDPIFATNADTPGPGLSLYRFSTGHGDLQCEACHGSTHAEYPSAHANDNLQSLAVQGHVGVLADCTSCHAEMPETVTGGPHGLHPIGEWWVDHHTSAAERGTTGCRSCHGADLRGTVLSRVQSAFTAEVFEQPRTFWRGFQIGCFACHEGPRGEDPSRNRPPAVADGRIETVQDTPGSVDLVASDADGDSLTLRVVSQPAHGTASLVGRRVTFFPDPGYAGDDSLTVAAWDGSTDSNLATVAVLVRPGPTPTTATPGQEHSIHLPFARRGSGGT